MLISGFDRLITRLPIQKVDTLETRFEQNICVGVRRLGERIRADSRGSEQDGKNGRKFSAPPQKVSILMPVAIFEGQECRVPGHVDRDGPAPPSALHVHRQPIHDTPVNMNISTYKYRR